MKLNSLKVKVWQYLIIFSISILAFLWLFQVIFMNSYYEMVKTNDMKKIIDKVTESFERENYQDLLDDIAHDNGVCIEVFVSGNLVYSTNMFNRGCLMSVGPADFDYRNAFIMSGETKKMYKLVNPRYENQALVAGIKLNNNVYGYISTSLTPIDSTIVILKNQLIYVTFIVFALSFLIAYFISKRLSGPIVKINSRAKKMASGDYNTVFNAETNIDELKELAATLEQTSIELGRTDELRKELLANVSHDLKTPLTMIKAYAEMTRDLHVNDKKKRTESLNTIIEETDRLNVLVNDILDLSSLQSNTTNLNIETFDLTELIHSILRRYDILKEKEQYNFVFEYMEPLIIKADQRKLEQVIYNLINNAINYTGSDLKVEIKLIVSDDKIRLEIIDTGKGIKKEDLPFIWDKYYKVDKNHKRNVLGTGLGLSIVKNILISHNYEYGVITKQNNGTTFWIEINR